MQKNNIENIELVNALMVGLSAKGKMVVGAILESPGINLQRDFILIQVLVETFEEYIYLKSKLKINRRLKKQEKEELKDPRLHENPNGTIQSHPYVQQLREAKTDIRNLVVQLGLSPMASAKLKLLENNDAEIIADVMKADR